MDFLNKRIAFNVDESEKGKKAAERYSHSIANSAAAEDKCMEMTSDGCNEIFQQQRLVQTNRRVLVSSSEQKSVQSSSAYCMSGGERNILTTGDIDSLSSLSINRQMLSNDQNRAINRLTISNDQNRSTNRPALSIDQNRSPNRPTFAIERSRPLLSMEQNRSGFLGERVLCTNGSSTLRSRVIENGDLTSSVVSRRSVDASTLFHQQGAAIDLRRNTKGSIAPDSIDPLDSIIEATLQKTMETYQRMVNEQRAELMRVFPQLANVRRTAIADQTPPTELITERITQPDGTILEVQKISARRYMQVQESINIIDGEVTSAQTRAVMEYGGPGGGYRLKLEEHSGNAIEDMESENEEDDEDSDRLSIVPSEISDTESVMALVPKHAPGKAVCDEVPKLQMKPKAKTDKAWYAARELVESERRYVEKLRLLDQVFRGRIRTDPELAKSIEGEKLAKLFANIGTLYGFHNDHLLPQLEKRLEQWKEVQKICDVMRRQAPFLKMYGEYTSNYKKATKTYDDLKKSNKRFAAVINEIEKLPECDHLPLSNHLICPVQRVTRYHLLMTEYLKNLGDRHPDKEDTEHALELTKEAASHANHIMRQLDKYKNVIEVQELLGSQVPDLLTPSRELVRKGRLMKISARNGEHQTRFAFLFNDMLLICSEHKSIITSWNGKYKLRAIFEVDGMHVLEGDNLDVENTFYVRCENKIVELYTNGAKEKKEWMEALWAVIQDYNQRMQSFRKPDDKKLVTPDSSRDTHSVTASAETCPNCGAVFNAFKKSYVCKSCGSRLCKKCCQKKFKLHDSEKKQRVCLNCYDKLNKSADLPTSNGANNTGNGGQTSPSTQRISRRSILEARPGDPCIWSGYLDMKTANRKSWDKRYFCLQQDLVLYSFNSEKDSYARTSMPITGCRISWIDPRHDPALGGKAANAFKLEHARRAYYFKTSSSEEMAKCVAAIELASQAQLPAFGS